MKQNEVIRKAREQQNPKSAGQTPNSREGKGRIHEEKKKKKLAKLRIQTDSVGLSGVFGSEVKFQAQKEKNKQVSK